MTEGCEPQAPTSPFNPQDSLRNLRVQEPLDPRHLRTWGTFTHPVVTDFLVLKSPKPETQNHLLIFGLKVQRIECGVPESSSSMTPSWHPFSLLSPIYTVHQNPYPEPQTLKLALYQSPKH